MPRVFRYPALKVNKVPSAPPIVFFAASCVEMAAWAGIPQKRKFGEGPDQETVGFQRQDTKSRVTDLMHFYADPANVIQNPLLCAARELGPDGVAFSPSGESGSDGFVTNGILTITVPDFASLETATLLGMVRSQLERRVPELKELSPDSRMIETLKKKLNRNLNARAEDESERVDDDNTDSEDLEPDSSDPTVALFEESHIGDFWREIAARHEIASELPVGDVPDPFLGFSRELLISYLQPTVLVDGQHRLKGALAHADYEVESEENRRRAEELVGHGGSPSEIREQMLLEVSRVLPISLLLSDDPAEQVFQFVVVNQKATPIGKALLGTIVSTSLGQLELEKVSTRLKRAGIPLEESRAISLVVRSRNSPFYGKVQRGIDANNSELLEWNILGQLISIFKNLEGGRLYGENNDYADLWKRRFLESSEIVTSYEQKNFDSAYLYWSSTDGPWLHVFINFWNAVKSKLASDDPHEANYWGNPRISNLFNKVSLTILSADFFMFLTDKDRTLSSSAEAQALVDEWLTAVQVSYFKRDWEMSGVKKDTTGIKKRWASLWKEYRKNPLRIPPKTAYRQALS